MILGMRVFTIRKYQVGVAILAAFVFVLLLSAVVVGQGREPVSSSQERIEVVSPAGVATFEGALRRPW